MTRRRVLGQAFAAAMLTVTGVAWAQHGAVSIAPPDLTPEQRMERRFPQPVRVGFLVGLPLLDENSSVIGRIDRVVRTPEGKLRLIVPSGGLFGVGSRLVAVPVEVATMLGQFVAATDMPRAEFRAAPTWAPGTDVALGPDESIRVGLSRR
jgi:hypothetical protein